MTRYLIIIGGCLLAGVLLFLVWRQHKAIDSAIQNPRFSPEQQAAFATLRWMLHLAAVYGLLFLAARLAGPDLLALSLTGLKREMTVLIVNACLGLGMLGPLLSTRRWKSGSLPRTLAMRNLWLTALLVFMTIRLLDLGAAVAVMLLPITTNLLKRIATENMFDALVERPIGIGMGTDGLTASVVDPDADGTFRINM